MAGRPKRKARQVAAMLEQADLLNARVYFASPDPKTLRHEQDGRVSEAWREAVEATMRASIALERLAEVLARKAGLEPQPSLASLGPDPATTLARHSQLAKLAGVTPPTQAGVEALHREREEQARLEAEASEGDDEAWDDYEDDYQDDDDDEDEEEEEAEPDAAAVASGEQPIA
jgi:hypothetical protein